MKEVVKGGGGNDIWAPSDGIEPFFNSNPLLLDVLCLGKWGVIRYGGDIVALHLEFVLKLEKLEVGALEGEIFWMVFKVEVNLKLEIEKTVRFFFETNDLEG